MSLLRDGRSHGDHRPCVLFWLRYRLTVADGVVKSGSFASSIAPVEDRLLFMDAVDGSIPTCVVELQALQTSRLLVLLN